MFTCLTNSIVCMYVCVYIYIYIFFFFFQHELFELGHAIYVGAKRSSQVCDTHKKKKDPN